MTGFLEFDGGATARLCSSFDTAPAQYCRLEATNGWLELKSPFVPGDADRVAIEYELDGRRVSESIANDDQYRLEVEHFAECVEEGVRPRTGERRRSGTRGRSTRSTRVRTRTAPSRSSDTSPPTVGPTVPGVPLSVTTNGRRRLEP